LNPGINDEKPAIKRGLHRSEHNTMQHTTTTTTIIIIIIIIIIIKKSSPQLSAHNANGCLKNIQSTGR
jgi:hypothetical protein